jgi:hypothetical protein
LVLKIMAGHQGIATTVSTQIHTQIDAWLASVPADITPPVNPPHDTANNTTYRCDPRHFSASFFTNGTSMGPTELC